jgi:hypothetical protein
VASSAAEWANTTKNNPYIQRVLQDAKLRADMLAAFEASRSAYRRIANGKVVHRALLEDKKLQADLRDAIDSVRVATIKLQEAAKPPKKRRLGRKLLILFIGGAVALAVSEKLRSKVLDTLFGAEEEFQYTPPAGGATAPPATPVTAA